MFSLNGRGKLLWAARPQVMSIINITPDSFYTASRTGTDTEVLRQAESMLRAGADMLDLGGQSSRPGAELVGEEEELRRVVDKVALIARHFPAAFISVDTWYAKVARLAVEAGAHLVNDISGGAMDPGMLDTVGRLGVPYVCMHMRGQPATMNREAVYEDVVREVLDYFIHRLAACRKAGIHDIILDPGMGFAKNHHHNLLLLKNLELFRMLDCPLLLGISRKSTIYRNLNSTPEEALNGTTVLNTIGLMNGADILRVHDPKEALEAIHLHGLYETAI